MRLATYLPGHHHRSFSIVFIFQVSCVSLLVSAGIFVYHHINTLRNSHVLIPLIVRQTRKSVHKATTMSPSLFTTSVIKDDHRVVVRKSQYYRRRDTKVNEYKYRAMLTPQRQPVCYNDTRVIVMVHSHPAYVDKRQAIRQTWGSTIQKPNQVKWPHVPTCCPHMRLFFLLGINTELNNAIREELLHHDDIIQGDFIDSYQNMTLKSLLGLKIVKDMCPGVTYLLKSDDDVFVNIPFLLHRLDKNPLTRGIMGARVGHAAPWRTGKWAVTYRQFPFDFFPPYIHGSSYVISSDIIGPLYDSSHYVPWLPLEDVYVTGILGQIVHAKHSTVVGSGGKSQDKFARPAGQPATACDLTRRRLLSATHMPVDKLYAVWGNLHRSKHRCW